MEIEVRSRRSHFDHERLDVYRKAVLFRERAEALVRALPPARGYIADQLQRAALSIGLNIAEGSGEFSPKEKARFYRMARRSATESAALLDAARTHLPRQAQGLDEARQLLIDTYSMLTRLVQQLEKR